MQAKKPYLTEFEKSAIEDFKQKLIQEFGEKLILIKLYGSRARGEYHPDSDIDLLIVLKEKTKDTIERLIDLEYEIGEKYGFQVHLETMLLSLTEYEQDKSFQTPFILGAEEDGIDIYGKG